MVAKLQTIICKLKPPERAVLFFVKSALYFIAEKIKRLRNQVFRGKFVSVILPIVTFFVGAVLSYLWLNPHLTLSQGLVKIHPVNADYKYVKPLLGFEIGEKKEFTQYQPLLKKLQSFITDAQSQGQADDVAVYFRDLDSGRWTGINENEKFSPGSLLKVPLMISYFQLAEKNPEILQAKLTYEGGDENVMETIKPAEAIKKGATYTVEELIRRMIVYSDNNAAVLLFDHLDIKDVNEVYSDLGLGFPEDKATADYISSKQYSLFFRILYNSSYLDADFSEQALSILAQTDFKQGISQDTPPDIPVAHKFGERSFRSPENGTISLYELHDCGIIYYPQHPYLLCVMSKGKDGNALSGVIRNISAIVLDEVKNEAR